MSDPPISDIHFKNKMALVWTTLNFPNSFRFDVLLELTKILIKVSNLPKEKVFLVNCLRSGCDRWPITSLF